jgi:hypothetical protein
MRLSASMIAARCRSHKKIVAGITGGDFFYNFRLRRIALHLDRLCDMI